MLKAIIFDMDGIIIDSEPVHKQIDIHIMKELNIDLPESYHETFVGSTDEHFMQCLKEKFHLTQAVEELVFEKRKLMKEWTKKIPYPTVPFVIPFIKELYGKIPLAVASSAQQERIQEVLENLELSEYFQSTASGSEVLKTKPAPDIFLLAATRLKVLPSECLVFEDSSVGTQAAKAADMVCIALNNPHSGKQDLSVADIIINTFQSIHYELLYAIHQNYSK